MIQQASQTQTQSATMDADDLMSYLRNQLGDAAVWNMPDTMNSAIAQANWALNSENFRFQWGFQQECLQLFDISVGEFNRSASIYVA